MVELPAIEEKQLPQLRWYDAACRALAEARNVDEVKEIRNVAAAQQAYAKQAKNKDLFANAWEITQRAVRRLGEIMAAQKTTIGLAKGGRPYQGGYTGVWQTPVNDNAPTLAQAGIGKDLAKKARTAVGLTEHQFQQMIIEGRAKILDETERVGRRIVNAANRAATKRAPVVIEPGHYNCVVIDPPWPMEKIERDVRPTQVGFDYPTMTEDELADFRIGDLAADDCHLFLWTTQRFLPMALRIVEKWGFYYVLLLIWHKDGGMQPFGLPQYNVELVVYARRGTPKFVELKDFPCCFTAPRRQHSRKPDKFYEIIRRVTAEPRIDIFSRERREGFAQYGNEIDKFASAIA